MRYLISATFTRGDVKYGTAQLRSLYALPLRIHLLQTYVAALNGKHLDWAQSRDMDTVPLMWSVRDAAISASSVIAAQHHSLDGRCRRNFMSEVHTFMLMTRYFRETSWRRGVRYAVIFHWLLRFTPLLLVFCAGAESDSLRYSCCNAWRADRYMQGTPPIVVLQQGYYFCVQERRPQGGCREHHIARAPGTRAG